MNLPIRYYGGKGGMYKQIIQWFPDRSKYKTYIEPFGGSYSIGFNANLTDKQEIYNDKEKNVYTLFKVLVDDKKFEEFKRRCDLVFYMEDFRKECKDKLKKDKFEDDIDRAFCFFYSNRTSHNSIGGFSKSTCIRRGMSKSVSDMLSSIDGLLEVHNRLSTVTVVNRDAIDLINEYDRDNAFFYCDPPYEWSTRTTARYECDMSVDEHYNFVRAIVHRKAKFLVSGYNCDTYCYLEENGFKRVDFVVNTIDGNAVPKEKTESLWMNYDKSKDNLF